MTSRFQLPECEWIGRTLVEVARTDGQPSPEQARILDILADELGIAVTLGVATAIARESLRRLSEEARLFLGDVAVILVNIDEDAAPSRFWIREVLPVHPEREKRAHSRAKIARSRIHGATAEFLHTVQRIAAEPVAAYLSAVTELNARKRQVLREAIQVI